MSSGINAGASHADDTECAFIRDLFVVVVDAVDIVVSLTGEGTDSCVCCFSIVDQKTSS